MIRPLIFCLALTGAALLGLNSGALATELGDAAPALEVSKWIKGDAVNVAETGGKRVYVVEFWATWCGPCRTSIPHLTELQKKFKDQNVTIIGVSDEDPKIIEPFVQRLGDQMEYVVAADKERATFANYMGAFNEGGIPHSFVINQEGLLVWHGHPMNGLDQVLAKVVAGTFDLAAAKKVAALQKLIPEYFNAVAKGKPSPEIEANGKRIVEEGAADPNMLNEFAWTILTHPAIAHRDLPLATAAAKKAHDETKGQDPSIVDTYARAMFDSGNVTEAIELEKKAIALAKDPDLKTHLEESLKRFEKGAAK